MPAAALYAVCTLPERSATFSGLHHCVLQSKMRLQRPVAMVAMYTVSLSWLYMSCITAKPENQVYTPLVQIALKALLKI